VREKSEKLAREIVNQVKPTLEHLADQKLTVNPQIDLYTPQPEEILLFEDEFWSSDKNLSEPGTEIRSEKLAQRSKRNTRRMSCSYKSARWSSNDSNRRSRKGDLPLWNKW